MSKSSRSFPSRYDVSAARHHRWARGDWQLLPWILGFAGKGDRRIRRQRRLPRIGRWKMIDNLRRTLTRADACVLALAVGWTLPLAPALVWTAFVLATIIRANPYSLDLGASGRRPGVAISSHFRALGEDFRFAATLTALNVTFLADQAWMMSDAIARTLWRLFVSRRHLLEWTPAAQATAASGSISQGFAVRMSGALVLAAAALLLALLFGHGSLADCDAARRVLAGFASGRAIGSACRRASRPAEDFGGRKHWRFATPRAGPGDISKPS